MFIKIKRETEISMKQRRAFTLMEILVVTAIIGLIAAVGVPLFLNAIQGANDHAEEVNIESVEAAKEQWSLENNMPPGTTVEWVNISNYMGSGITDLDDLDVDGKSISIGKVGTRASY